MSYDLFRCSLIASTMICLLLLVSLTAVARAAVLVDFQVSQPPIVPSDVKQCTVQVLQRDFAFSFGHSEVVDLVPPTDCGPVGSWSAITLNLTVTSNGTQFDRLGIFTFQNVEIWRTSTPEPTRGDGIIWTYIKDVSQYMPLFETAGTFIFQLDNLIEQGLDGIYSSVVHATYYASSKQHPPANTANLIVPLSTLANDTGNDASVPPGFSLNVTLPSNTVEIYAELFASGNGQEEFWYTNAANDFISDLPDGTTFGQGPFREVRLLIDGQVAGVAFPYPVIFTGGIIPSFWRPITSYGALELPTYFLDVTPFAPLLSDGNPHNFTIDVPSAEADHSTNQNWFVSGLLQVITDSSSKRTTGKITKYAVDPFATTSATGSVSQSDFDVEITVKATRSVHIEADVIRGNGKTTHVVWTQDMSYSNFQVYTNEALTQFIKQTATGDTKSTHNGVSVVSDSFSYPLELNMTFLNPAFTSWTSEVDHSYDRTLQASPLVLGTTIHNHQITTGFFQTASTGNTGNGTSNNTFTYSDTAGNTYQRIVNAALNNITFDKQSGSLAPTNISAIVEQPLQANDRMFAPARLPGNSA
ncbi:peptide N-acetyl-beta-D-glucosaminyl asparaginase amidase A-domain-containing protein [Armillaria fumosa]|nr:peptide N-acetyl-beta-D-glucosaminyl asparaginase amidase A-domain-containing protein [Armillaria fumosa]